jgi:signal transduction histidine kinase
MRSLKLHTRDLQRGGERRFSVLRTLEDTALLLSHRLRLSQCTLTVANTAADANLYGDPSKLGQVLTNLIINAIDAYNDTEEKGGKIAIDVSEAGPFLEIRVSDQGCGIPSAHLEKIFDEFFSTKPLGEGTGLGLSISRHIIANFFGGTISVSSTVGCGTTFTLRLPRGKTPVGEQPHAGKSSPAKAKESFKIAS